MRDRRTENREEVFFAVASISSSYSPSANSGSPISIIRISLFSLKVRTSLICMDTMIASPSSLGRSRTANSSSGAELFAKVKAARQRDFSFPVRSLGHKTMLLREVFVDVPERKTFVFSLIASFLRKLEYFRFGSRSKQQRRSQRVFGAARFRDFESRFSHGGLSRCLMSCHDPAKLRY